MQVIVFDTETTDLIKNDLVDVSMQPRIVELCAVKIQIGSDQWGAEDEWVTIDVIDQLYNPGIKIPPESTKITGISDEMVRNEPLISQHWQKIRDFFAPADFVVAHNLTYDMGVMNFEQKRVNSDESFPWPKNKICTVEATESIRGHRLKLNDLHTELFGEGFNEAHRAKNDVLALLRCFKKLWAEAMI